MLEASACGYQGRPLSGPSGGLGQSWASKCVTFTFLSSHQSRFEKGPFCQALPRSELRVLCRGLSHGCLRAAFLLWRCVRLHIPVRAPRRRLFLSFLFIWGDPSDLFKAGLKRSAHFLTRASRRWFWKLLGARLSSGVWCSPVLGPAAWLLPAAAGSGEGPPRGVLTSILIAGAYT